MSSEFDGIDFSSLSDEDWSNLLNGQNNPTFDPNAGAYDPRLDPNAPGAYDPRLDTRPGGPGSAGAGNPNNVGGSFGNFGPGAPVAGDSSGLGSLLKAIGLGNSSGDMNWPLLMSLLAAGAGGIMSKNATSKATDQILGSIKDANTQVSSILGPGGGAAQSLSPYLSGGAAAMQAMPGMIYKAPGAQFSGPMDARISLPPISLSSIMKRGR